MKAKERFKKAERAIEKMLSVGNDKAAKALAEAVLECFVKSDDFDIDQFLRIVTDGSGARLCKEFKDGFWFGSMLGRMMTDMFAGTKKGELLEKMIDLGIDAKEAAAVMKGALMKGNTKDTGWKGLFENK